MAGSDDALALDGDVGFGDIFGGEDQSDLSVEKFDDFWDRARPIEAKKKGIDPNQLVRFVHNGKIHWITQDEASTYLQLANTEDKKENAVKKEIKRAMRGETQSLSDELNVLLAISASTLNRYKRDDSIAEEEVRRIEPTLQKRFQEVEQNVGNLRDVEGIVSQKRKKEPIFDEYEQKLGEMMNLQRMGKTAEAAQLAQELAAKKRQYVIMSRAIEPDVYTTYHYRMELQKCKKRVLSIQKYLAAQRENSLESEIEDLKSDLRVLEKEKDDQEGLLERGVSIDHEKYQRNIEQIEETQEKIADDQIQLESLAKESKILVSQIQNVDDVISYISEEVLKDSGYEDNIQQQVRTMAAKKMFRKPPKLMTGKSQSRMVTTQRHARQ